MLLTIIIGIIVFVFIAGIINSGYQQMKIQEQNRIRDSIMHKYSAIRDRQNLYDSLPALYFPPCARRVVLQDILQHVKKILSLNPYDNRGKNLLSDYQNQLEQLEAGEIPKDNRKAQSLSEAENMHHLIRNLSDFLKNKHSHGHLTAGELSDIHSELEYCYARSDIDGELVLAETASNEKKYQFAYYLYDRILKTLLKFNREGVHDVEIAFVENQLANIRLAVEEAGETLYDPNERSGSNKQWNKVLQEEDFRRGI